MARHMNRSAVTGRFTKMGNSIEDIENVSASDVRPGMEVPRHALAGDTLAGPPYPGALQPRFARMTPGGSERMVYAIPHPGTLSGQHTAEAGRPVADELTYLVGDVDASAPGEVAATQRYGVQGRRGREAARLSSDPTTRFVTGAE
jgi:hypothetical protein